jgi:hypothetical protein
MRVVYDNVGDVATLTASNQAGSLVATNLQIDDKGQVWRSTGTAASLTAVFTTAKTINMVALPFTNLTSSATMRIRGYTLSGDASPAWDITAGPCVILPFAARADGSGVPLGANKFAYGQFSTACRWFTGGAVQKVVVDLADGTNPSGYIEAARIIMGDYWTPSYNPDYGAAVTYADNTKNDRSDAGSLLSDKGIRYRKMTLTMSLMKPVDRQKMKDIFRINGMSDPVFISLFPQDADPDLEDSHMLYGKLATMSAIALSSFSRYAWPIDIEEV